MSDPERFDDVTHDLVTGLDGIAVPPSRLRATARRRGFPLLAVAATALVVVLALAIGTALRPANDGGVAAPAPAPTATSTPTPTQAATQTPTPADIRGARSLPEAEAKRLVEARATYALNALKSMSGTQLASIAHPDKGVRFSMYANIHTDRDQVLTATDLPRAFIDPRVRLWGISDGKGEDVRLTFADYYPKWVWDVDFSNAPDVAYNRAIGTGNTIDNSATVYPDAVMVEYHFAGFDPQYGGMDWRSLRLFFEQKNGTWYLVGIVHAQWTT